MSRDAARDMKVRMRTDLTEAMKGKRADEARLLRALVAALDNAEAPALQPGRSASEQHRFQDGSAEIERLKLDPAQVRAIRMKEIEEREQAADEMSRLARPDRADALRAEARMARRYLD